ncbi:hypothetical protein KAR91_19655 [Candidatus Pacearchaeota archaeon]|nr:hypothetical protein [Candidatus Pacearchaeota archaeon]
MLVLLEALKTRYESTDGATVRSYTADRYYLGAGPEKVKHPLIEVVTPGGNVTEETLACATPDGARHETVNVDFVIHDDQRSPKRAWQIADALKLLYDGKILTLSGTTAGNNCMIDVKRQGDGTAVRSFDDDAWSIVVTYQYKYETIVVGGG